MLDQMNHIEYPKSLQAKTMPELSFIIADVGQVLAANPFGPKAGYYEDERHYAAMEMIRRQQRIKKTRAAVEALLKGSAT